MFRYDLRLGINEDSIGTRNLKFTDKPYTEKEIQDTIDKTYGEGHYKIDWNKYIRKMLNIENKRIIIFIKLNSLLK